MTAAADLWTAVKADYDAAGLVELTNIRDRTQTTINDAIGTAAAQGVINFWPIYAQTAYDPANALHVSVAEMGVIALLWRRGGASVSIEQVRWEEVFGADGMINKLKATGPRAHAAPTTNSGVQASTDIDSSGKQTRPWSDPAALPVNSMLPRRVSVED